MAPNGSGAGPNPPGGQFRVGLPGESSPDGQWKASAVGRGGLSDEVAGQLLGGGRASLVTIRI